jgi:hypothetical protein
MCKIASHLATWRMQVQLPNLAVASAALLDHGFLYGVCRRGDLEKLLDALQMFRRQPNAGLRRNCE